MVQELWADARELLAGRTILDGAVPVLVFGILAGWSLPIAATTAIVLALAITVWRRVTGRSAGWALGGLLGVVGAAGLALLMGRAGGFFLPGVVRSAAIALVAVVSVLFGLPMVAWTSRIFRRWPNDWYRHPKVRPAYVETTLVWAAYFGSRALVQGVLLDEAAWVQAVVGILWGWPGTVALLTGTYFYGIWRLARLGGPSIGEWTTGEPLPQRGF